MAEMSASALLDRYFLDMRHRVLDLAAALDRLDRADGAADLDADDRLVKLREAIGVLVSSDNDRAVRVLRLFSRPYDPKWRAQLKG